MLGTAAHAWQDMTRVGVRHHIRTWHASHMLAQRRMHGMVRTHTACMLCHRPEAESCGHSMLREQERHNHAAEDQRANKPRVTQIGKTLNKPDQRAQHRLYSTQQSVRCPTAARVVLTANKTYSLPVKTSGSARTRHENNTSASKSGRSTFPGQHPVAAQTHQASQPNAKPCKARPPLHHTRLPTACPNKHRLDKARQHAKRHALHLPQ